jgi:hypothetical protein
MARSSHAARRTSAEGASPRLAELVDALLQALRDREVGHDQDVARVRAGGALGHDEQVVQLAVDEVLQAPPVVPVHVEAGGAPEETLEPGDADHRGTSSDRGRALAPEGAGAHRGRPEDQRELNVPTGIRIQQDGVDLEGADGGHGQAEVQHRAGSRSA